MFLHEGTARFFGTIDEMRLTDDPVLKEFLALDKLILPA
jgi:phospholipid/cholesterol/gamma-HCH transport system ATP-binding protein